MGNWRTVHIVGQMESRDVMSVIERLTYSMRDADDHRHLAGPLAISPGLCGLGRWPAPNFDRIGNLFERDYSVESVAEHLTKIVGLAPTMRCQIHCGGDYESRACVATIHLIEQHVSIGKPMIDQLGEIPKDQIEANMRAAIAPFGWIVKP